VNYRAVYDGSWAEYGSQGDKVEVYRIKDKTEEE
jgi:3-mercaptopyruvate sulfurtransferase SseA